MRGIKGMHDVNPHLVENFDQSVLEAAGPRGQGEQVSVDAPENLSKSSRHKQWNQIAE